METPNRFVSRMQDTMYDRSVLRAVLIVSTMGSFLTPFIGSMINLAIPQIGSEFGADAILLGWIPTVYLLASAMFLIPIGKMADIYGRRKIFILGIIIIGLTAFLAPFSPSVMVLIALRAIQGFGSACIFGTAVAILTSAYPKEERGRVLGINVTGVYAGLSLGPVIGGVLTHYLGWRSIFFALVPLCIIVFVMVHRYLHEDWRDPKAPPFDLAGAGLYAGMICLGIYGITAIRSPTGIIALISAVILVPIFIHYERRTVYPVFDIRIFLRNRVFALSNIAALINYSATFAIAFLLSLYLQVVKGLDPQSAGLILVSQPLMQVLFSSWAGRLSDRIDPKYVASAGMGLNAVGLLILATITAETTIPTIITALLFLGFGFALFSSPNTNAVMSSVHIGEYGVAAGTVATMRQLGMVLSMGITLFLFGIFIGSMEIGPEQAADFIAAQRMAFLIYMGLCSFGVIISLARNRKE
ncbi:multidrug resistance protein [Methanocalculus alkaliphilus]|uniref:MFS transporter n=1 Tax=Methanocalculus alkaliphilus TaxID=768730 RepID=UPI00209DE779|nr:MFS transporter [Methanocalculus alkaliphilus]MCP1714514.1 multidrug resistance protein [Methanocalculus alkaliphilus]